MKRTLSIILSFSFILCISTPAEGQDKPLPPPDPAWEQKLLINLTELIKYNREGDSLNEAKVTAKIGNDYLERKIFRRAAFYFNLEHNLYKPGELNNLAISAFSCANAYDQSRSDSLAAVWYMKAAGLFDKSGNKTRYPGALENLGNTYARMERYDASLAQYNKLMELYSDTQDKINLAKIYYRTGTMIFREKEPAKALEYFENALNIVPDEEPNYPFLTDLHANTGVCHQNMKNESEMMRHFELALRYAVKAGLKSEEARLSKLLSEVYFIKTDYYHAELYCIDAIESAAESGNLNLLHESYLHYSDILKAGNDFIKALEYYEEHLALRDSLNFVSRMVESENEEIVLQYEELEQRLRTRLSEQEIRDLELERLKADSARRANEILLLMSERELEKSENDRLAQAFELEKERFELSRREQEVISLRRQQEIDSLTFKQKEDEAAALEAANQLLEKDKLQKETELKNEKLARQLTTAAGVLIILVAAFILFGLISTRKKNQKLAESKRQIEIINADLEKTNAEVLSQKEIIEQKNQSITDSIQYASRIQTAVLPPEDFLTEWGLENFILFKPKDIVSGDFYWGNTKNGRIIAAAADCTGHGVPGAFMSMLGNAFLDDIVNNGNFNDAAEILNLLRNEIINTLKQKGTTGEARDGMDISLSIIDPKNSYIDFAGANNPLYLVRNGEMIRYPADKMPIGIHFVTAQPFTNHNIKIVSNDVIYMFSDGYADQFGGPKGRKLMYKPFQEILLRIHMLPMNEQKEILEAEFEKWKGDFEQVDDVLVMGIRL